MEKIINVQMRQAVAMLQRANASSNDQNSLRRVLSSAIVGPMVYTYAQSQIRP